MSQDASNRMGLGGAAHNNVTDAMRHAFLNAVIADKTNIEFAKDLTDAHEEDREQDLGEKIMDLYNNNVGRELYQQKGSQGLQEVWNSIVDKAASGGLKVYDASTGKTTDSSLTDEQVKALKEIKVSDYVK